MIPYGPSPSLEGKLTEEDFPKEKSVTVVTQDGSTIRLRDAFYHREGDWIVVYTRQSGIFSFKLTAVYTVKGLARTVEDRFAIL